MLQLAGSHPYNISHETSIPVAIAVSDNTSHTNHSSPRPSAINIKFVKARPRLLPTTKTNTRSGTTSSFLSGSIPFSKILHDNIHCIMRVLKLGSKMRLSRHFHKYQQVKKNESIDNPDAYSSFEECWQQSTHPSLGLEFLVWYTSATMVMNVKRNDGHLPDLSTTPQ